MGARRFSLMTLRQPRRLKRAKGVTELRAYQNMPGGGSQTGPRKNNICNEP